MPAALALKWQAWRCDEFAFHFASWLLAYALLERELKAGHGDWLCVRKAVKVPALNQSNLP